MTKVDIAALELELAKLTTLDDFHKRYVALKYLDLHFGDIVTSFSQIENDIYVRTAFRNALDRLEMPLAGQAESVSEQVMNLLMRPLYHCDVPEQARIPVTFRNQLERVEELLSPSRMPLEHAQALWGVPHRGIFLKRDKRVLVDDVATTVAWFMDYVRGTGNFDVSNLKDAAVDIRGYVFPDADALPYSATEPGKAPFMLTYRIKSRERRDEKALAKMSRLAAEARKAFHDAVITREVPVGYRRMIEGPEQYWSDEMKLKLVGPRAINDPIALMAFFHGGHVPGANDDMTRAAKRIENDEALKQAYEMVRLAEEHNPRLHRIKFRLTSRNPPFSRLELALVDEQHHVQEYEFGPYAHPDFAQKRLQGYFDEKNEFHYFTTGQQKVMKFFSDFRL